MGIKRMLVCASAVCALVLSAGAAYGATFTQTQNQTTDGQDFTFTFNNLPISLGNVTVTVGLYGDYDLTSEYADVLIDGVSQVQHQGGTTQCNTTVANQNYTVAATAVNNNNQLVVNVNLSAAVAFAICQNANPRVTVTVTYTSRADLRMWTSLAPATGSTAGDGQQFTVTSQVQNLYENLTTNFWLDYFYCPTAADTGCTLLGFTYITDDFTPGQIRSYTSPTLTMPATAEVGTRYILFKVDSLGGVTEADETNNNRFDAITVSTLPDLSFTASTVPQTGSTNTPGSVFTAQYTIANADNTNAIYTDFVVNYAYCPTCNSNTGCLSLGTNSNQTITQNINSGATYTFTSGNLVLPASATTGFHCIRAIVDNGAAVAESNENNNVRWHTIYVGSGALPDLLADQLTVPATGSVANAGATFTMTSRIRNNAAVAQNTDFQVNYYYCPTATTTGCTYLNTQLVTTNLAANGNTIVTSPSLTMPANVLYGAGQIRVYVDATGLVPEADETNNNSWAAINVTAKPDLTIASVAPVPFSGDTNGPGSTFTARFTVTNKAQTSYFNTDFQVEFFYCPTNTATGCVSLGTSAVTFNFLSGASFTFTSGQLTIPATATPGAHYLRAFVDSKTPQDIDESDETNNNVYAPITLTTGAADIYVKTFTATAAGQTITYTVETCNKGGATTTAMVVGLFYNRTTAPTCADTADDSFTIAGGLAANGCNTHVFTRAGAPVGASTPYAMGDQGCAVTEGDETNNTASASVTVAPPPDQGVQPDKGVEPDYAIKFDAVITKPEATVSDVGVPPDQALPPDVGTPKNDTTGPAADQSTPAGDKGTPSGDQGTPAGDTGGTTSDKGSTPSKDTGAPKPPTSDGGCSCSIQQSDDSALGLLGLLLGLALVGLRRRRR